MARQRPTFSVIMPAYNAASTIPSAIQSVLRQSRGDFELIVVDDGSTDGTRARVEEFDDPRIRAFGRANGGPAAARNHGIARARGIYLSMLDSDDIWLPGYLESMAAALEAASGAAFAYTDAWVLDDATGRIRATTAMAYQRPPAVPPADPQEFLLLLLDRNFVFTAATVRRSVIDEVGGYDEQLWYGEDYELWVRIVAGGHAATRVDDVLVIHRDRPGSLTSDTVRLYEGVCRVYGVIEEKLELDAPALAVLQNRQRYWARQLTALHHPSTRERGLRLARAVKQRLMTRSTWLDQPPPSVTETLCACRPAGASA
jgi:glycosyltransferase involved in cell wall biosynthesis